MGPQIGNAALHAAGAEGDDGDAEDQQGQHRQHLDQREPEFEFAEHFDMQQIGGQQHAQHHQYRHPLRQVREPVAHIDAHRGQFGDADHDPQEPVGPAGDETGPGADEFLGIGGEGARYRAVKQQLAQRAGHEKHRHAAQRVSQQQTGTGLVNGLGRAQEQTRPDRPAQRDHLHMTVFQAANQPVGRTAHAAPPG